MKRNILKVLSLVMVLSMLFCIMQVSVSAKTTYKITNPYESVTHLLGNDDNHYKTNLHTHSTYSDATIPLTEMVKEHYNQDFDILGIADHGVVGEEWNVQPTLIPLYQYNPLIGNKQAHFTTEEYESILAGTYSDGTARTKTNGMQCLTGAIEGNMLVVQKNHVNGYFMDDKRTEGVLGDEGDFNTMIEMIEDAGGVSHINHPGDWLSSANGELVYDENGNVMLTPNGDEMTVGYQIATDPGNVQFFANSFRLYKSCLGIEVYNAFDRPTRSDRVLWDELLKVIIPEGRNVWGFANNDAHTNEDVDTCFMDFVLPEYSQANVRTAMENGTFFAVSRYEWGDRIGTTMEYPTVTSIVVDDATDTITITGKNTDSIKWIADGVYIQEDTVSVNGVCTSTIKLQEYSEEISCYVRAEIDGPGGRTLTQAFVCDDGNMDELINRTDKMNLPALDFVSVFRKILKTIYSMFTGVIVPEISK
ncbi:MAG: hypothetical protein J6Q50_02635 [Clostridia bacterium]|nr:hypothetical protein [Clostridia bacterium]